MTQSDKLQALIENATKKGYSVPGTMRSGGAYAGKPPTWKVAAIFLSFPRVIVTSYLNGESEDILHPSEVVFDLDFAKALFGEPSDTIMVQNNSLNVKQVIDMNGWRYHLQQAVIADDPIGYMYGVVFDSVR